MALTERKIKTLTGPTKLADGLGLYLCIDAKANKTWSFRYYRQSLGGAHELGLGRWPSIGLEDARREAHQLRGLLDSGKDPKAYRQAIAPPTSRPFREVADLYIGIHAPAWGNATHAAQWPASLAQHVYPRLGTMDVAAITVHDIEAVLRPIWHTIPETASRVRARMERILDFAKVKGWRSGDNPASWNLQRHLFPSKDSIKPDTHHRALHYAELPAFMTRLRQEPSIVASALRFIILTASRTSEVLGATWGELDLGESLWIVPPERMKARRQHLVPLSTGSTAILAESQSQSPYLFPSPVNARGQLNDSTIHAWVSRNFDSAPTIHGFRATFRTWAEEQTTYAERACELALAHGIPNATEAAYRRAILLDQRRGLMQDWSDYCMSAG